MDCIVPNCDAEGRSFTLRFPRNHVLCQRWRTSIELGSGRALPAELDSLEAEVCQQHFEEVDEYSEPVLFRNESMARDVYMSSCRLCLRIDFADQIYAIDSGEIIIGDIPVEELLKTTFQIQLPSEPVGGICEECLVKLDMVASLKRHFCEGAKSIRRLETFIKEENRLRYKKVAKVKSQPVELDVQEVLEPIDVEAVDSANVKHEAKLEELLVESNVMAVEVTEDGIFEEEQLNEASEDENLQEDVAEEPEHDEPEEEEKPEAKRARKPKKMYSDDELEAKTRRVGRPRGSKTNLAKTPKVRKVHIKHLTERKCYLCVQLFETDEELFSHISVHVDHPLYCELCSETFPSLTKYNRHLAKHDPEERPFKCDHCELRFCDGLAKRRHEKQKHNVDHPVSLNTNAYRRKGKYTCHMCGKQCFSMSSLREHEDSHAGIKRYECKSCGRLFANKNNLERHHLIHTSELPFKCTICGKGFRQSPMYKDHMRLHTGETPYACNGCDQRFSSTSLLRRHKIRDHGQTPGHVKVGGLAKPRASNNFCRFCLAPFRRHMLLVDHVERFHADQEVEFFNCQLCDQRFVEKNLFETHVRHHDKSFQCELCEKRFASLEVLKNHEARHHEEGKKGYVCKTCDRTFSHVANLKRHELLHLGIKRFECDFCGKRFAQSNQLHVHRRTHTGERPYTCHCGKKFADNSTLCKHRKSVCKPLPVTDPSGTFA
ncbi:hypothetical protein quinque_006663 [Culex quinquefasciatus]|uniref:zinc finger protein 431 n=1 Tax=Culex quinquefasciatus TaxID=7176 RepID=UPI0018E30B4F|nr:zinc finger protein 431 [Culex quinquefasciatus]